MNHASKQTRKTLLIIGAALAIVITGVVYLSFAADPNRLIAANDGFDPYRVSLTDAKTAFDSGDVLIVDVRTPGEFSSSHIPGAVSIPLAELNGNEPQVDKGALIYTYCT